MTDLIETRGSLTAIIPSRNDIVTIGNSGEQFRITEIVARDGFTGSRLVANGHYTGRKRPRTGIPLHDLRESEKA